MKALGLLLEDISQSNYHSQTEGTCLESNKNAPKLTGLLVNICYRPQTKPSAVI